MRVKKSQLNDQLKYKKQAKQWNDPQNNTTHKNMAYLKDDG